MIFRQLFEPLSSTYTYLLGCEDTRQAVLIDPVLPAWERDLGAVRELGLTLAWTLETHVHADHITSALKLKQEVGSRVANAAMDRLTCTDFPVEEGRPLEAGSIRLDPLHTPGHTASHFSYSMSNRVFTGDALLIDGCGRTDFQGGDAAVLYRSIHDKIFSLPEDHLIYPAHDYQGHRVSSVAQELRRNPRLGGSRSLEDFVALMGSLKLAYPKFIDYAVAGNQQCGVCPDHLPAYLLEYCERMQHSVQG